MASTNARNSSGHFLLPPSTPMAGINRIERTLFIMALRQHPAYLQYTVEQYQKELGGQLPFQNATGYAPLDQFFWVAATTTPGEACNARLVELATEVLGHGNT